MSSVYLRLWWNKEAGSRYYLMGGTVKINLTFTAQNSPQIEVFKSLCVPTPVGITIVNSTRIYCVVFSIHHALPPCIRFFYYMTFFCKSQYICRDFTIICRINTLKNQGLYDKISLNDNCIFTFGGKEMKWTREEYIELMTFGNVDRPMFVELFGPLVGLPEEWRAQGATGRAESPRCTYQRA